MKGSDIASYMARFCDLALLCMGMVTPESKKIERYIWGLMPPTQGNVLAARPTTFDSAKCLAQTLIDHGVDVDKVTSAPEPAKVSGGKKKVLEAGKGSASARALKEKRKWWKFTLLLLVPLLLPLKHLPIDMLVPFLGATSVTTIITPTHA